MLKLVIFDLDGTLLNTIVDLTRAVNDALGTSGFAARTDKEVLRFVGDGVKRLVRRALPAGAGQAEEARVFADFLTAYSARNHRSTAPYPGVATVIETLTRNGVKTAVLSNKYDAAAKVLVARYFPSVDFTQGETESVPRKPDPAGANAILQRFSVNPAECVLVGDSEQDAETARRAGIAFAAALWGARKKEDFAGERPAVFADTAEDLLKFFSDFYGVK